jgi:hypothetical protein
MIKPALHHVALRCSGDLDEYIFSDYDHAYEWLTQGFVTDEDYSVEIVTVKRTKCCHREVKDEVLRKMSASSFIAEYKSGREQGARVPDLQTSDPAGKRKRPRPTGRKAG